MRPVENNTSHIEPSFYSIDKILSIGHLSVDWPEVPVYSYLFAIRYRSFKKIRPDKRFMVNGETDNTLQSMGRAWT